jgi:hypothetical protein
LNGNAWQSFLPATRKVYLQGVFDGMARAGALAHRDIGLTQFFATEWDLNGMVTALDRFYSEPENGVIPIMEAGAMVVMKFRGGSQESVDARALRARQAVRSTCDEFKAP